jgi:serine kinase of HPr protein (carbohydrate metabolism regulator)
LDGAPELVHATAIAVGTAAALIRGPSGSGKSDLALRCLALAPSPLLPGAAHLVADDQVLLSRKAGTIVARAPEAIRGKLEVRGVGILTVPFARSASVRLVVDLLPGGYDRMPDPDSTVPLLGVDVPHIRLAPFEGSAAAKLLLALTKASEAETRP